MTEQDFWNQVDAAKWNTDRDYDRCKAYFESNVEDEAAFFHMFTKMKGKLHLKLTKYMQAKGLYLYLGDDSYEDFLAHVVGCGSEEFSFCMENLDHAHRMASEGRFVESFNYAVPIAF